MTEKLFYSTAEAAAACGVSERTLLRAKKAGRLRAKKTAARGGKDLFAVADLHAWFEGLSDA